MSTNRVAEIIDTAALDSLGGPSHPSVIVATMRWDRNKIALVEGTQSQPLTVVLSQPLPVDVSIGVVINPFTQTTQTQDFAITLSPAGTPPAFGFLLRIAAGQLTGFVNISVPDDAIVELTEFMDLELQAYHETVGAYDVELVPTSGAGSMRVTLSDAPVGPPGSIFWSFDSSEYFFDEGASPQTTRVRVNFTAPLTAPTAMRFWTTNGTATGGANLSTPLADYVTLNQLFVVAPGATVHHVNIRLIDDALSEGAETFTVHGEVLTPGTNVIDGPTTSTVVTINPSDNVPITVVPFWDPNDIDRTIVEGSPAIRLRVHVAVPVTTAVSFPVTPIGVTGADLLSRLHLQFPGGVYGTVVIQPGGPAAGFFADILCTAPYALGVQPTMNFTFTIGNAPGVVAGSPSVLELEVLDAGVILPIIAFRDPIQAPVSEGATTDLFIEIDVTNAGTCDLSQGHTVQLAYSGGAAYGSAGATGDYTIHQLIGGVVVESPSLVTFAPGQTTAVIRLRTTNNALDEPTESYVITLENEVGCELGAVIATTGEIIDDDAPPSAAGILPQFYFASETFGRGPNQVAGDECYMVADIGPGITFGEAINITMTHYSPNATLGVHYSFPDGLVLSIGAGQRYGRLRFRALAAGTATTLRWVVVKMLSAASQDTAVPIQVDHYTQQNRWVGVLTGATDDRHLVPPVTTPSTGLDDYQVYANRIEDLTTIGAHGPLTIPLPYPLPSNPAHAPIAAKYGAAVARLFGNGFELYNGAAIAAHLAQAVWLDRNGFADFGTFKTYVENSSVANERIDYLEPHVPWMDQGLPVYISVYEEAANGPHDLLFCGDNNNNTIQVAGSICWGRHLTHPDGPVGTPCPSATRDLYITSRVAAPGYSIARWEAGCVQFHESVGPASQVWRRASFLDNVHFQGFRFHVVPGAGDYQRKILTRQPPRWTTKQPIWLGLIRFDAWTWTSANPNIPITNFDFHLRSSSPAAWILTNCVGTRASNQMFYLDSAGPFTIIAYNSIPTGTGRAFFQLVSRNPWRTLNPQTVIGGWSAGPSHGLLAVIENTIWGFNDVGTASDLDIYGHLGQAFFLGNRHRGDVGSQSVYNRRIYGFHSSGNEEGMFVAESLIINYAQPWPGTPVNSPVLHFTFRYVEIEDADMSFAGTTGEWFNDAITVTGCYAFVFKPVIAAVSLAIPMSATDRSMFSFNPIPSMTPNYYFGAIMADPLNRPLFGIGYTPGDPATFPRFPNRGGYVNAPPGGVDFTAAFGACIGGALGSTKLATHYSFASGHLAGIPFSSLPVAVRNDYDGRDPNFP